MNSTEQLLGILLLFLFTALELKKLFSSDNVPYFLCLSCFFFFSVAIAKTYSIFALMLLLLSSFSV